VSPWLGDTIEHERRDGEEAIAFRCGGRWRNRPFSPAL
jgi:hypothetical protein